VDRATGDELMLVDDAEVSRPSWSNCAAERTIVDTDARVTLSPVRYRH
jgi:hypothetical protein